MPFSVVNSTNKKWGPYNKIDDLSNTGVYIVVTCTFNNKTMFFNSIIYFI